MSNLAGSGIYCISFPCGKVYVGQSIAVSKRLKQHYSALKNKTHQNTRMQSAWDASNGQSTFALLESVAPQDLNNREAFWVEKLQSLDSHKGLNIACVNATASKGFPCEAVEIKSWTAYRRIDNGYWNATHLCDQFGKRFDNWVRTQHDYDVSSLIDSGCHGVWIHPDLVMLIACWLSPSFYLAYMQGLRAMAKEKGRGDLDNFLSYVFNRDDIDDMYGRRK